MLADVVVTTLGAVYFAMLISDGFYGPFITFISLAVLLSAWIGIFLIDMMK